MKRWRLVLLVVAWIAAVLVMVYFAVPNSFRRAAEYREYQERQQEDAERRAAEAGGEAPADANADGD